MTKACLGPCVCCQQQPAVAGIFDVTRSERYPLCTGCLSLALTYEALLEELRKHRSAPADLREPAVCLLANLQRLHVDTTALEQELAAAGLAL
jgi:hypothetical protein